MDCYNIEGDSAVMIKSEMPYEQQQNSDGVEYAEVSSLFYGDDLILSPQDTFNSDELLGFEGDDGVLFIKEFNYEKMDNLFITHSSDTNDGSSDEHSSSSISSDTPPFSHTKEGDDILQAPSLSEDISFKGKTLRSSSKTASCLASSKRDICSGSVRRSYSIGDSNSKNAIAARDNRLKKKKYIADLEESQRKLCAENEELQIKAERCSNIVKGLQNEISYLRSVIANQSTLSAILKSVLSTPGINFSSFLNSSGTPCDMNIRCEDKTIDASRKNCSVNVQKNSVHPDLMADQSSTHTTVTGRRSRRKIGEQEIKTRQKRKTMAYSSSCSVSSEEIDASTDPIYGTNDYSCDSGICLHVSGKNVSLEFCSSCNAIAHQAIMADHSYVCL